jgi:hypothetical protein
MILNTVKSTKQGKDGYQLVKGHPPNTKWYILNPSAFSATHLFDESSQEGCLDGLVNVCAGNETYGEPVATQEVEDVVLLQVRPAGYVDDEVTEFLPHPAEMASAQWITADTITQGR